MALTRVRYKGLSAIRTIKANDDGLKERNIKIDKDLSWRRENGWQVFVRDPSEELMQLFRDEGTFTVSEVKEDEKQPSEAQLVTATRADDTGDTVVDGNTGQKSTKKK